MPCGAARSAASDLSLTHSLPPRPTRAHARASRVTRWRAGENSCAWHEPRASPSRVAAHQQMPPNLARCSRPACPWTACVPASRPGALVASPPLHASVSAKLVFISLVVCWAASCCSSWARHQSLLLRGQARPRLALMGAVGYGFVHGKNWRHDRLSRLPTTFPSSWASLALTLMCLPATMHLLLAHSWPPPLLHTVDSIVS